MEEEEEEEEEEVSVVLKTEYQRGSLDSPAVGRGPHIVAAAGAVIAHPVAVAGPGASHGEAVGTAVAVVALASPVPAHAVLVAVARADPVGTKEGTKEGGRVLKRVVVQSTNY